MSELENTLKIGLIQTNVDDRTAWNEKGKLILEMNAFSVKMVMDEIRRGFKDFEDSTERPKIVLIPEYSIPKSEIKRLEKYAQSISAVVIGGMDLIKGEGNNVFNKGIIIIPNKWPNEETSFSCNKIYFGKTFYSETELEWFEQCEVKGISEPTNYIIDAGKYGNIGIAICSDFYDIERFVLYKGKIHHLIIISYNKDYKSFEFLAEAISRLLFCNVIICNTGNYGDSLAYSPYKKEFKRTIYKNAGQSIFASQVIEIPVMELDESQTKAHEKYQNGKNHSSKKSPFKWPPGYEKFNVHE